MRTIRCLIPMIILLLLLQAMPIHAQVYTIDFLTYSDQNPEGIHPENRWKITSNIFKRLNEFDANGNVIGRKEKYISDEYYTFSVFYLHFSYRLHNGENIKINAAIQGWFYGGKGELNVGGGWGTPWLWANIKPFIHTPLWLRIGYKFGKTGTTFRIEDNQCDIGLLYGLRFGSLALESSVSYRIRSRATETEALPDVEVVPIGETTGLYDQAGNEIHYKVEPIQKLSRSVQLSLLLQGYYSSDKKYHGTSLPDSKSYKTSLGTSLFFHKKTGEIFTLSFLWDLRGRYEEKGFTIAFNVAR